jgi:hypothetical protein
MPAIAIKSQRRERIIGLVHQIDLESRAGGSCANLSSSCFHGAGGPSAAASSIRCRIRSTHVILPRFLD